MEKLLQWMVTRRCRAAEVAAGAASVEVAADAYLAKNINTQRQMAGQMTSPVWHLLTQWYRRCQSDSCSNKMNRLRRRELHKVGAKAACGGAALRAWTQPGSPHRDGRTRMRDTHN